MRLINIISNHPLYAYAIFCLLALLFSWPGNAAPRDAIAIRIIANPEHYSPVRWYEKQEFTGSPQSLLVDGYQAVRDGRSVYVNVANVVDTDSNGTYDRFYTNIYLISYNQSAETATQDIFGQILSHWKFNTNVTAPGSCSINTDRMCLNTADCSAGQHCLSPKAKIIRDAKRLADMADLKIAIGNHHSRSGYYPRLSAGSYLAGMSVSTWPSWSATLGRELGINAVADPLNNMGDCGGAGYDKRTCWDEVLKSFAGTATGSRISLPAGSSAYAYASVSDGAGYLLTAGTESGSIDPADGSYIFGTPGVIIFNH